MAHSTPANMHWKKMKPVLATVFLLLIGLSFSVNGADVSFQLLGATDATYRTFVEQLRNKLSVGTVLSNGIPVLKPSTVRPDQRFLVVTLTPYNTGITISVGIDVSNSYVVAFSRNDRAYFLSDAPAPAYTQLFTKVPRTNLTYNGGYPALEKLSRSREETPLGFDALNSAISNLWYSDEKKYPAAFLVIIQMVAEAARYTRIELYLAKNALTSYLPDQALLSLENNWGRLSSEIKSSVNGEFKTPVTLQDKSYNQVIIRTVSQAKSWSGIALLLS